MWNVFNQVVDNLGMSFENVILLLVFLGGLIFYSRDARIGIILHFFLYAGCFAWFYSAGLIYGGALILMFMFLVFLALSLYAVDAKASQGGLI